MMHKKLYRLVTVQSIQNITSTTQYTNWSKTRDAWTKLEQTGE